MLAGHVPPGRGRGLPGLIIDLMYLIRLEAERSRRQEAQRERARLERQQPDLVATARSYLDAYDHDVLDEADFLFLERHGDYYEAARRSRMEAEARYRHICEVLQAEKRQHGRIITRATRETRYRPPVADMPVRKQGGLSWRQTRGGRVFAFFMVAAWVMACAALAAMFLGVEQSTFEAIGLAAAGAWGLATVIAPFAWFFHRRAGGG